MNVLLLGFIVFSCFCGAFFLGYQMFGYDPVYLVGYGAIATGAAMIAITFKYLYAKNRRDIAFGMAVTWSGMAVVMGYWWTITLFRLPPQDWPVWPLFIGLSLKLTGFYLHMRAFDQMLFKRKWIGLAGFLLAFLVSFGAFIYF